VAMMMVLPYLIAGPLSALWVLIALAVRATTGWKGLLPAHLWPNDTIGVAP